MPRSIVTLLALLIVGCGGNRMSEQEQDELKKAVTDNGIVAMKMSQDRQKEYAAIIREGMSKDELTKSLGAPVQITTYQGIHAVSPDEDAFDNPQINEGEACLWFVSFLGEPMLSGVTETSSGIQKRYSMLKFVTRVIIDRDKKVKSACYKFHYGEGDR